MVEDEEGARVADAGARAEGTGQAEARQPEAAALARAPAQLRVAFQFESSPVQFRLDFQDSIPAVTTLLIMRMRLRMASMEAPSSAASLARINSCHRESSIGGW